MKKLIVFAICLLLLPVPLRGRAEASDPWEEAFSLIRLGRYPEALDALRSMPDSDAAMPFIEALSGTEHAEMRYMTEETAAFLFHGLWGFVTFPSEGDPVWASPRWTELSVLKDGLFLTCQEWNGDALYGVVTSDARVLYPGTYHSVLLSGGDRLILSVSPDGPVFLASASEYLILSPPCDKIAEAGEGLWAFRDTESGKWGMMDREGNTVLAAVWDGLGTEGDGLVPALKDGLWGYIDTEGNEAIPFRYLEAEGFRGGCADVREARYGWRIISADGSVLYFKDDLKEFDPEETGAESALPARTDPAAPADYSGEYTVYAIGYEDYVFVTVTLDSDGTVTRISVNASAEAPDRGRHAEETAFTDQFVGKKGPFVLGEGIDGITGATMTVGAVLEALNSLYD